MCTHNGGKSVDTQVKGVCSGPTHTPTHVSTHNMCAYNTLHHGCAHNTLPWVCTHNTLPCRAHTTHFHVVSSPHLFISNHSSHITFFPPSLVSLSTPFSMPHAINAHQIAITKRARNNRCALKKVTTRYGYKQNIHASKIIQNAYAQATHLPNNKSITKTGSLPFIGRH